MTAEEKITKAIEKSGLDFRYLIMCDDNGRVIGIKNQDVYSSKFGKHTNDYNQNLDLDPVSKMTISDIAVEILKKWGVSKESPAAALGRMTSKKKMKSSAENGKDNRPHIQKIKQFVNSFPHELINNEFEDKIPLGMKTKTGREMTYNPDYYCPELECYIEVSTSKPNISEQGWKWRRVIRNGTPLRVFWWEGEEITNRFL